MKNKVDYAGRTVDLLLLKTVLYAPVRNKRVDLDVADKPMIVSGIEKMVQRFALLFLTKLGSSHYDQGSGARIMTLMSKGMIYDMPTLTTSAAEACQAVLSQIKNADMDIPTEDDERLENAEVINLDFNKSRSSADINVRLTAASGDTYDYIIPVEIGVRQ